MSTLKSYHHGDLRAALLDSALTLVNDVGVEGLSLREVCRCAGVSHAAIYNHFPNKAALVRAFVERAFEEFGEALGAARDANPFPLVALREIGVAYVIFAHEHPARFKIMFRPELSGIGAHSDLPSARASHQILVDAVEASIASGRLRGAVEPLVRTCWALVHGLALLATDGASEALARPESDLATTTRESLALLLFGMLQPHA